MRRLGEACLFENELCGTRRQHDAAMPAIVMEGSICDRKRVRVQKKK